MSRKKISTTIYVTPEQDERLRLLHDRTKVPVAVYIREGIDLVLRQYGHLLPGQLPLTADAPPVSQVDLPASVPAASSARAAAVRAKDDRGGAPQGDAASDRAATAPVGKG